MQITFLTFRLQRALMQILLDILPQLETSHLLFHGLHVKLPIYITDQQVGDQRQSRRPPFKQYRFHEEGNAFNIFMKPFVRYMHIVCFWWETLNIAVCLQKKLTKVFSLILASRSLRTRKGSSGKVLLSQSRSHLLVFSQAIVGCLSVRITIYCVWLQILIWSQTEGYMFESHQGQSFLLLWQSSAVIVASFTCFG